MDGWLLTPEEETAALKAEHNRKKEHTEWQQRRSINPLKIPDFVELTEDEKTECLIKANKDKELRIRFESIEIAAKQRRKEGEAKKTGEWTYKRVYLEMSKEALKRQPGGLIYNKDTEKLIKTICFRISGDERYETELGFSFDKLLILRGNVGVGKSWLVDLVKDNPVCPIQIITMHEIVRSVMDTGNFTGFNFAKHKLIYIDDVGTELANGETVCYMGTKINFFRVWFEDFYSKNKSQLNRLIFSTNDSFDVIEKKYGFRVRDRFAEADVLDCTGPSLRRK
jgi:hypothetical protein